MDICGHPCQVAIAPWGMNLECSTKWEDGCKGIDPPEGFTSQSTLYQLCPNECFGISIYFIDLFSNFNKVTYRKQVFLLFEFIFIETVEPECSNLKSDVLCNKWSSDGYCTSKWLFWATWMMKNCKKTCNKC